MDIWDFLEIGAWGLSAAFGLYIVTDWIKVDRSYSEEMLTSSCEGEIEALTEQHRTGG